MSRKDLRRYELLKVKFGSGVGGLDDFENGGDGDRHRAVDEAKK